MASLHCVRSRQARGYDLSGHRCPLYTLPTLCLGSRHFSSYSLPSSPCLILTGVHSRHKPGGSSEHSILPLGRHYCVSHTPYWPNMHPVLTLGPPSSIPFPSLFPTLDQERRKDTSGLFPSFPKLHSKGVIVLVISKFSLPCRASP